MNTRFDDSSTFQLASALRWGIKRLRQEPTPEGRVYFVDLNGVAMRATEARKLCIAEIERRQAGMPTLIEDERTYGTP